ncbi:MAG: glycerate kinase [Pseudomonadota bacterium]|nr:glycerate kinase [Pseudomonadota bacterium]
MQGKSLLTWVAAVALGALAWRAGGWAGIALLASALVLWLLLGYTRVMAVARRAAQRPIGYVDSAVMLNARLRAGQPLLHVMALTRAMGQRISPEGAEPEVYRWEDPGQSHVTAEFERGRLVRWRLKRPVQAESPPAQAEGQSSQNL